MRNALPQQTRQEVLMPNAATDVARRFIDEVFIAGSVEAVDDLVTPDFVSHPLPGSGPDVMKAVIARVSTALSGATIEIEETISEGNRVAIRLMSSAVHSGTFMGMPATGKSYSIEEIHIFRIEGGRVAEHWHQLDAMGMLRQLGLGPGPKSG
jgi:steroid delta-isomerase-like uncharacterized protein